MEARVEPREQLVAPRREGKKLAEMSATTGYARTCCSKLAKEFDASPRAAAKLNRGGRAEGTGRKLTAKEQEKVQRWIRDRRPDQLRLPCALWTLCAVKELIRREIRMRLPRSSTAVYLSRRGFTSQRPKKCACERDDAAVKRRLKLE